MNKKIIIATATLLGVFLLFFVADKNTVSAQSCDGSYMCGQTRELCDCSDGGLCDVAVDGSSCGEGGNYTCSCYDDCVFCGQNCGDPISCGLGNGCVIGCGDCWADWSWCSYTPPEATNTPPPTSTPGSMWCGNCDNNTCILGNPTECANVGDTDGDGACEGQCENPTNTPGGATNTPTPANSPREILGLVKRLNTSDTWYRSDEGACPNDVYEDTSNSIQVRNSNGTGIYNWDCNPSGDSAYHVRASGGGEGPYTFTFTPPDPYDCNQVSWGVGYGICVFGCSDPQYVPPDSDPDGDNITNGGTGCTAELYLGPEIYDNHIHWSIDMDNDKTWINGIITDPTGQRYSEIPVGSCTLTGPQLDCPICDAEEWLCWPEGPHFDLRANTGTCTDCVSIDPTGAGYSTCDYRITTRDCSDIGDISLYSTTDWVYNDCSVNNIDIPGDCDWQTGVQFRMRNDCQIEFTQPSYQLSADSTISVYSNIPPGVDEITYTVSDASKVAICPRTSTECTIGQDTVVVDTSGGQTEIKLTGIAIGTHNGILSVNGDHTNGYTCTGDVADVTVDNPPAWWQVFGGGVWANNGIVYSSIPPATNEHLVNDLVDLASNLIVQKGIAASSGTVDPDPVSDPENWQAEGITSTTVGKYNFDYFYDRLGQPAENLSSNSVVVDTLESCDIYKGYRVCYRNGSLNINLGDDNIGDNKIIVLARGDIRINTEIKLNDGRGFLMIIAGGDLVIDPYIGNFNPSVNTPNLEGIFLAIEDFVTENNTAGSDIHLNIRGTVVGLNLNDILSDEKGVTFKRSLGDNSGDPSEIIDFAPDQILRFPPFLGEKYVLWQEVAP